MRKKEITLWREALSLRERAGATASGLTRRVRARMEKRFGIRALTRPLFRLRPVGLALRATTLSRRERAHAFGCSFVALFFLCYFPPLASTYAQESPRSVWDAVYNEEQAKRGQAVFLEECSNCHGRDLEGADMTPPLTGAAFMSNWDGLTVGDLSERIRISMPLNRPGTLPRQQNVDVIAYILRFNQFPAGKEELPREVQLLKQILFKATRP